MGVRLSTCSIAGAHTARSVSARHAQSSYQSPKLAMGRSLGSPCLAACITSIIWRQPAGGGTRALLWWIRALRRVVMGDEPGAVTLYENHGEARGRWYGLAVLHPGEFVKPGTEHGFIAQNHDPLLADHDLGAAARQAREVGADRVSPFGKDWAHGAEEKRIARVELQHRVGIVSGKGRCTSVDDGARILGRTGRRRHRRQQHEHEHESQLKSTHASLPPQVRYITIA